MTKHRGRKRRARAASKFLKVPVQHLLEAGTLDSMRNAKLATAKHLKYQWNYYAELARQRSIISEKISKALTQASISYPITKWQRAVKYKYGLHPFSTVGSLTFIGGRFNTGMGVNQEVPYFPALYLAQDKDTALQEHLGQQPVEEGSKLAPREVALINPASETIVSVSGKLDKVFDLTDVNNLNGFIELVKNFKLSSELVASAKELGIQQPGVIKKADDLLEILLHPDWRQTPSIGDVPSNSQIFGHLVYMAGIEGILYPSKFTGKRCLAVFPRNFVGTDSFVALDDEAPHPKVPTRIDANSWRLCELTAKEVIGD